MNQLSPLQPLYLQDGLNPLDNVIESDDTLIIKFVNRLLLSAIEQGVSDIHFEPFAEIYRIRFRIDGLLVTTATPAAVLATRINARIKVMANLDISERRLPQDGRIHFNQIDWRVSTCPTLHGEKIVVRLLNAKQTLLALPQLAFSDKQLATLLQALHCPQGLILVSGPTGSGKTTTLYSAINYLNTGEKNIVTVEDPVEIDLFGITQVNIHEKIGLGFAPILRAFLRQDPDVMMIGELRDAETADLASKAAQTGHLVLATVHANSATETLTRLLHLGLSLDQLVSSLRLIIAQRLVRRLCDACKTINQSLAIPSYQAQGCQYCVQGYRGRIAIFEMMPVNQILKAKLLAAESILAIQQQAEKDGMQTLYQAGVDKLHAGLTTPQELQRILGIE